MSNMRTVILHHHIFKNAGSSVEASLASNFGEAWRTIDGATPSSIIKNESILDFFKNNPKVKVLSSHQARPFFFMPDGWNILPLILVRDPLDRIRSCFDYEHKINSAYPSSMAAQRGIKYYIDFCLDMENPDRINAFRNYQTLFLSSRLSLSNDSRSITAVEDDLVDAKQYVARLNVIGIVEYFSMSMAIFEGFLRMDFPSVKLFANNLNISTNRLQDLDERKRAFMSEIGVGRYEKLLSENSLDVELYDYCLNKFRSIATNLVKDKVVDF